MTEINLESNSVKGAALREEETELFAGYLCDNMKPKTSRCSPLFRWVVWTFHSVH
jgi:hypothetical protein